MNARATIQIPAPVPRADSSPAATPVLLDARDAAQALAISEATLYRLTVPRGNLPCVRIARRVLYRPQALAEWAAQHEEKS